MGDYIKQRVNAMMVIDKFASSGKFKVDDLAFHIMRLTGFTKRFILNYLNECIERGEYITDPESKVISKPIREDE